MHFACDLKGVDSNHVFWKTTVVSRASEAKVLIPHQKRNPVHKMQHSVFPREHNHHLVCYLRDFAYYTHKITKATALVLGLGLLFMG